ncbi:MAG: helix-turn-helix domain-containing protein [Coriobacteriia bacterium]|nr:helix-turn-helix domain-containing protein [Coriobacteriia bacterium]
MNVPEGIRRFRKGRKLRQREIAEAAGVSVSAVSNWENDRGNPSIKALKKLVKHFNVGAAVLLGDVPSASERLYFPTPMRSRVPLVGKVSAGELCEEDYGHSGWEVAPEALIDQYPDARYFQVVGDSMDKVVLEGMLVLVSPSAELADEDVVLVASDDGCGYEIRRILFAGNTVVLHPESHDPVHEDTRLTRSEFDAMRGNLAKVLWAMYPPNAVL